MFVGSPIQHQIARGNKPDTLVLAVSWSTGASGWHINDADLPLALIQAVLVKSTRQ